MTKFIRHCPHIAWLMVGLCFFFGAIAPAKADLDITVSKGQIQPTTIAITQFESIGQSGGTLGPDIVKIIQADLARSGLFIPLDRASFIQTGLKVTDTPKFSDWRIIRAQALVIGQVNQTEQGKIIAQFRLWDPYTGKQLAGSQFAAPSGDWRRIGHMIADSIYQRMTGEKPYFDTQIAFVDETGPKNARKKRLAIMDQDTANVRYLTSGRHLVLTPRFNPVAHQLTYMSYETGIPRVYLFDLSTGQKRIVGDFPNMSFAPRFSPDGLRIIMSLQKDGSSNIYEMNLVTRQLRALTRGASLDTAPSFAPDGGRIVFESDKSGNQQLYVMSSDGTNVQRISRGEGRYSTPVWSPRGDLIAFTKQVPGRFLIGVMRPDGTGERILTEGYHNEGPSWAPNGRVLTFFRDIPGGRGGSQLFSVDLTGHNEQRLRTPSWGSDPAWSPLISKK